MKTKIFFPDKIDAKLNTPLHYAAKHNRIQATQLLIENGAIVDSKGEDEMTPLHLVCRYGGNGCKEVLKYLIEHAADIDAKDM